MLNLPALSRVIDFNDIKTTETTFEIGEGAFAAFVGPSGSGKSTLLNLLGCLDHPTSGTLTVNGTDIATLSRSAAASFRGEHLGFIFQDFNLVPVLSAFENIEYPLLMVRGWSPEKRRERVEKMIAAVDMTEHAHKRPDQLSGGQKQRVAVARALVGEPRLVLADEPTANLDHDTAYRILNLMKTMRDSFGALSTRQCSMVRVAQSAPSTSSSSTPSSSCRPSRVPA